MSPLPIILLAISAAAVFVVLEWRRPDRRHLAARLLATLLAVAALALLGLHPTWQPSTSSPSGTRAVLRTPQTPPASDSTAPHTRPVDARYDFALPGAAPAAHPIPDAAYLRRHFPEIGTIHLLGDGLDPAELDALRGLRIEFTPHEDAPLAPGLRFLHYPRELTLGTPLLIDGSLGIAPRTTATLTLESPDGATAQFTTPPADASGQTRFTLRADSPPTAGRFLWHLRIPATAAAPAADLPLGVAVVPPNLPRLLILQSAPRFDIAALRRWFAAASGTVAMRTRIGQDRYQYAVATSAPAPSFAPLTASLLSSYDLVLADTSSFLALPAAERDTLLAAVADTSLGVLLLSDDTLSPASPSPFLPWKLAPLATDTPGSDRPARLQWPGQSTPTDLPVPTAPFEIVPHDTQLPLLGDRQGHTLAAATAHGRGQLALTLVRDTTRWQRENDPAAFAAYWSYLLSRLARPADAASTGRWTLLNGDAGPVFVDHPLELLWSGPAAAGASAVISSASPPEQTTLALAPDPTDPTRWRGTFWPRHPGWHHVALASGGPAFEFYVDSTDAWPALDAARRRTATARFAEMSSSALADPAPASRREFPPIWFAALFFLAAAYLWIERRFAS